jgi:predicted cobalt transporter CbtA
MVGKLLLLGMLVGVLAGVICSCFLKIAGEPSVDRAIAFEAQMDEAKEQAKAEAHIHDHGHVVSTDEPAPELVSRSVQAGLGLFIGTVVYSAAFGGIFALAFAFVYGRLGSGDARIASAMLAAACFIAIYLIPGLKYPASPPSIGEADTIGTRTALYFAMMAISIGAMIGSVVLRKTLLPHHVPGLGAWNASLIAAAAYLAIVIIASILLPAVDEVPPEFPAVVLWQFRIAALGAQAILWAAIGLVFGALTHHAMTSKTRARDQDVIRIA